MVATHLRFIHISDTHFSTPDYEHPPTRIKTRDGVQALIEAVNGLQFTPDFIVHTGDVAYDPDPEIYHEIKAVFAQFNAPVFYLPGNHDHNASLQSILMERETVAIPLYYEREMNGVRLIFMDSNGPGVEVPAGHIIDAQVEWLKERLATDDDRPILIFVHHPLIKTHFSEWYDEFMMTVNGEAVHQVLVTAKERIRGVFHGHVHQHINFYRDNILYVANMSSWVQFFTLPEQKKFETLSDLAADPGFNVVTVTDESTIVQHHRFQVG